VLITRAGQGLGCLQIAVPLLPGERALWMQWEWVRKAGQCELVDVDR